MGQLVSEIVLNLGGNLATKARTYGNSMTDFANKNKNALGIASRSVEVMSRGLDRIGNRYTALAAGLVTGATVRGVANYEASLVRLGTNAQLSNEQVAALNKTIREVSNQKDIRINSQDILDAADELISLTGDFNFANDNLKNIGYTMQAFGADSKSSAQLLAQFWEKNVRGSDAVTKSLDQLYAQFAVGSVGVKDIARLSPELFSAVQMKGPKAIAQMGALLQMFKKTSKSADEASTSVVNVFRDLSDHNKIKFLKNAGVDVYKKGTREFKEPIQLLDEILNRAKYDKERLSMLFSGTSMDGLTSLLDPENRKILHEMISGNYELGSTIKASEKNAKTFNAAMAAIGNTWSQFADKELAQPIQELADAINEVSPETVNNWLELGKDVALVVGGVVALNKVVQVGRDVRDIYGFVKGVGKAVGKGKSGAGLGGIDLSGATPVYVVNMPGGGLGGLPTPTTAPTGSPTSKGGKFGAIVNGASNVANKALVIGAVYEGSQFLANHLVNDTGLRDAARKTDVGRYIDDRGIPGMSADLWDLLKTSAKESQQFAQQQQAELYGNLNIRVSDDRVRVTQSGFQYPSLNVNIDNGRSMAGGG